MLKQTLTQERLKEVLHYNPDTGIFIWIAGISNIFKGTIAGRMWSNGYIGIRIDRKEYAASRLAFLFMTGEFPKHEVDHINHIKDDNRWCNMRDVTATQNQRNRPLSKNNTSGVTGVFWYKRTGIWVAAIKINRKAMHLGSFADFWDAICARKSAEYKYGFHKNHGN